VTVRRRVTQAVAAGIGALVLGLLLHFSVRPWIAAYFARLDRLAETDPVAAADTLLHLVAIVSALHGGAIAAFGLWISYAGWQTVQARRWPYPGMKIHRRWKVLEGRAAAHRGVMVFVLGLAAAALGPLLGWKTYAAMSGLVDLLRRKGGL
jgi:hypothetical protein